MNGAVAQGPALIMEHCNQINIFTEQKEIIYWIHFPFFALKFIEKGPTYKPCSAEPHILTYKPYLSAELCIQTLQHRAPLTNFTVQSPAYKSCSTEPSMQILPYSTEPHIQTLQCRALHTNLAVQSLAYKPCSAELCKFIGRCWSLSTSGLWSLLAN